MKQLIALLVAGFLMVSSLAGQSHMPPSHDHGNSTVCWGYAMARSAGKYAGENQVCNAMTVTGANAVYESYFPYTSFGNNWQNELANVKIGDILSFQGGSHVAYVRTAGNLSNMVLDQVENENSTEEMLFIPLQKVIDGGFVSNIYGDWFVRTRGNPIGYFRRNKVVITVQNSFTGGVVKVAGTTVSAGATNVDWWRWRNLEAIGGQTSGGYIQRFNKWTLPGNEFDPNNPISIVAKKSEVYTANFLNEYDITFQNNFIDVVSGGVIEVGNTSYTAPKEVQVLQYNNVTGKAVNNQTFSSIKYTFENWSTGSTNIEETFAPTGNTIYTAHFEGRPLKVTGFQFLQSVGESIRFSWNAHPNANVNYRIYREISSVQGPTLIATLSHGTTSYTDVYYQMTSGYTEYLMFYDARAYYTTEATEADVDWHAVFGGDPIILPKTAGNAGAPIAFGVSNYPNPFNPNTTIYIELPEASSVTLAIYDLHGRDVRRWNLGHQNPGYIQIDWDGRDRSGKLVSAGMYFYRLQARSIESEEHFLEVRKMLFLK